MVGSCFTLDIKNFMQPDFRSQSLDTSLEQLAGKLIKKLEEDDLVQSTTKQLRESLQVDRVVMYYFYREWKGQVTFESLASSDLSIFGSTGADDCFNDQYAEMYKQGRVKAIADIELEPIQPCHRDFLRSIKVRANLVVPILVGQKLWGLLVAHQTRSVRLWSSADIELMQQSAIKLASTFSLQG